MNILLVRPKPHKDTINLQSFMICEPLELEYLSAYLESFGHNVQIIDMIIEKKPISVFIKKFKPNIVGFTAYLPHVQIVKDYAKEVKNLVHGIVTVVGGVHAEVVPQDFEDPSIDFIVKVNGVNTFKEIIDHIELDRNKAKEMIPGVWSDSNKNYLIDPNIQLPFPDRHKTNKYRKKYNYVFHEKCATIKTSYGCPCNCEFCFCIQIAQNNYYERDIKSVVEEIKQIEEKNIFIVDDNFLVSIKRVKEFCSLLEQNYIKKNFILFGRADFIVNNKDIIELLKEHGLKAIFVGIESFKEEELANFNKKTNVEMNIQAVNIIENMNLECYSGIIVGYDWEKKDFNNLIDFLRKFKRPILNIQPISPMPGTPLYKKYESKLTVSREKFEIWDMAHLLMEPTKMNKRHFYYQIIRTYYRTCVRFNVHFYLLKMYGLKIYIKTLNGVLKITWQYLKLMLKG